MDTDSAAEHQPELEKALESLRPKDVLLVTALDSFGGGLRGLIACLMQVQAKGASVRTLQGCFDTRTANGKLLLEALLSFDRGLTGAAMHHRAKAAQQQGQQMDRPPLLDVAAARLGAAHSPTTRAVAESAPRARCANASARAARAPRC